MKISLNSPPTLAAVAALGLAIAIFGTLKPASDAQPISQTDEVGGDVLARVGDRLLTTSDLQRAVESQSASRRGEPDVEELRQLLDSLIDEELLIQRAEVLGLLESDPTLRRALETAAKQKVADAVPMPGDDELREFFEANRESYGDADFESIQRRLLRDQQRLTRNTAVASRLDELRRETPVWKSSDPVDSGPASAASGSASAGGEP